MGFLLSEIDLISNKIFASTLGSKAADSSIYVLNNITVPAVLIECGFISNQRELELLKSSDYQCKLALTLFSSISNIT